MQDAPTTPSKKGTKSAKLLQTSGVLVLIITVIAYVSSEPEYMRISILGFIVGVLIYGVGRFLVWWRTD